jgi:hypothetical protein
MNYVLQHWHEVAYLALALIFVATYVLHFLPGMQDSKLRKLLEVETILMVVLIFVAIIAARVEKVAHEMDERAEVFSGLIDDALRDKGLAKVREIGSATELYGEMSAALGRSSKAVRITRLRAGSVAELKTGRTGGLFEETEAWLDAAPGRVLYRLASVAGEGMERWFEEECSRTAGATNLGLKKIEGSGSSSRMNLAVFDDREVFLIASPMSGPVEATKTVHIEDPVIAAHMAIWFDQLFESADGCGR